MSTNDLPMVPMWPKLVWVYGLGMWVNSWEEFDALVKRYGTIDSREAAKGGT